MILTGNQELIIILKRAFWGSRGNAMGAESRLLTLRNQKNGKNDDKVLSQGVWLPRREREKDTYVHCRRMKTMGISADGRGLGMGSSREKEDKEK